MRQYRAGQTVSVYDYEGDPGEPFLERPTVDWSVLIAGLFFGGIPIAIGVVLSGGALFFGRIRDRFRGSGTDRRDRTGDAIDEVHDEEPGRGDDGGDGGGGGGE